VCSSFLQFRLAGQKGMDATASRPLNQRYSKLHFIPEFAFLITRPKDRIPYRETIFL
jgi:hypothetical protein